MDRQFQQVLEALKIFEKYPPQNLSIHDEHIYAGPSDPELLTPEEKETLDKLGWNFHQQYECYYLYVR